MPEEATAVAADHNKILHKYVGTGSELDDWNLV